MRFCHCNNKKLHKQNLSNILLIKFKEKKNIYKSKKQNKNKKVSPGWTTMLYTIYYKNVRLKIKLLPTLKMS